MISTILAEHRWLAPAGFIVVVVIAPVLVALLQRRRRVALVLAVLAVAVVAFVTLYPDGRIAPGGCVLRLDGMNLLAPEPLANVVLFIPLTVTLSAVTRRPVLMLAVGAGMIVLIETLQWAIPAIGRSCTLADGIANLIGAALGGALATLGLFLARRRPGTGSDTRQ